MQSLRKTAAYLTEAESGRYRNMELMGQLLAPKDPEQPDVVDSVAPTVRMSPHEASLFDSLQTHSVDMAHNEHATCVQKDHTSHRSEWGTTLTASL